MLPKLAFRGQASTAAPHQRCKHCCLILHLYLIVVLSVFTAGTKATRWPTSLISDLKREFVCIVDHAWEGPLQAKGAAVLGV